MMKFYIFIFIPMILKSQINNTNFSTIILNSNISNINIMQNTLINLKKEESTIKINSINLNQIQNIDSIKVNEIKNSEYNFNSNYSNSNLNITTNMKKIY